VLATGGRRAVIGRRLAPLWRSSVHSFTQFSAGQIDVGAPFLTGSAPQTEFDVTHSKQTTGKFLTGARMHIRILKFWPFTTQDLAGVHAFQRISTRHKPISRMRRNLLKINTRRIPTPGPQLRILDPGRLSGTHVSLPETFEKKPHL
jgi:hypothetical protein